MNFRSLFSSSFFAGLMIGVLATATAADVLGSTVFPDVQPGSYYDAAVGRLYGAGIVKGTDGKYNPGEYVTRADIAVMLDRALNGGATATTTVSRRSSSSSSTSSAAATSSSVSSVANVGEAGAFRFALEKVSFPEGAANVTLLIQRYGGAKGNATVKYATADGTGKAGVRYNETTDGAGFSDGETSKSISLHFINNLYAEPNETFTVTLKDPTGGAVIGSPSTVTVTILDNDGGGGNTTAASSSSSSASSSGPSPAGGTMTLSAWAYALEESGGAATITVLRKGSSSSAATVDYATTQGTATAGVNYSETKGTLSFGANETSRTFSIPVIDNTTIDGNKNLTIKLSNATGGAGIGDPNTVLMTVVDDEANASATGSVMFSADNYNVDQKDSGFSTIVTVYRRGSYKNAVTVNYATSDSTAIANADYTPTSGTLTFAAGESNKTFTVPIIAGKFSGTKRLNLTLSAITGPAVLGTQSTSMITITGQ